MNAVPALLVWLLLMLLLGAELLAALSPLREVVPFIGIGMAALVGLTYMRLGVSRGLAPVFAVAGLFWLCVMIGLGSLDSFTRHDLLLRANNGAPERLSH